MVKLTQMSLAGYKSIRDSGNLELRNLNVLIGANGSGKSNLISFFGMLNAAMRGELQIFVGRNGGARSILHFGPKVTAAITAKLQFKSETESSIYEMRLIHAATDALFFASEKFRTEYPDAEAKTRGGHAAKKPSESIMRGASESGVVHAGLRENKRLQAFQSLISGLRPYHFHDTSLLSGIRGRGRIAEHRQLYTNGENLAAVLSFLRNGHRGIYERIVETVRIAAPFFGDFVLDPPPGTPELVMLNWRARGYEYELGPHQLSDGTLRFIALTTLLLQPPELSPMMLLIDEPELGLHPTALNVLAGLLNEVSARTQIIVSTQSTVLLDSFTPDDVVVVERKDEASVLRRLNSADLQEWLSDYSLGDLVRKNFIESGPQYA